MSDHEWVCRWLDAIRDGKLTMSHRRLSSINSRGGIEVAIGEATKRGIHLIQLTDDHGYVLVAASKSAFRVLC